MPVFPQPPELNDALTVLQLRAQWTLGGMARGESSWSFVLVRFGPIDQTALLWEMWDAACHGHYVARRASTWTLDRVLVEDRYPALRPTLEVTLGEPGGGGSPDSAPGQVGPLISWRSDYPGRSYRGRTYWGPVMKDDLQEDFVNNACANNVRDFADAMFDTFCVAGMTATQPLMCIISRRHDNLPEPIGRFAPVTTFRSIQIMATQRRRLLRGNYYGL